MDFRKTIKNFKKRIVINTAVKTLLLAFSIGFLTLAISGGLLWFFELGDFYTLPLVFAAASAISFGIIFTYRYKNLSNKKMARQIDELGLEERVITMEELSNKDSYIVQRQREDTIRALMGAKAEYIPRILSTGLLVLLSCSFIAGGSSYFVAGLNHAGIIPNGVEFFHNVFEGNLHYILKYTATEGGELVGYHSQYVNKGEDGTYIIAVPQQGYVFSKWSDGLKSCVRLDTNVGSDVRVKAIFEKLDDADADESLMSPKEGKNNKGGSSEKGDGDAPPGAPGDIPGDGGNGGDGNYNDDSFLVINGEISYRDLVDAATREALERIKEGNYTEREIGLIEDYFQKISQ